MVIGCGLWVVGYWLLVVGYWLLVRMQIDRTVYLTIIPKTKKTKTNNKKPTTKNQQPTTNNQQPTTNNPNKKSNGLLLQLSIHRMHTPP